MDEIPITTYLIGVENMVVLTPIVPAESLLKSNDQLVTK